MKLSSLICPKALEMRNLVLKKNKFKIWLIWESIWNMSKPLHFSMNNFHQLIRTKKEKKLKLII